MKESHFGPILGGLGVVRPDYAQSLGLDRDFAGSIASRAGRVTTGFLHDSVAGRPKPPDGFERSFRP